jgi:hypothetical protein
MTLYCFEGVAEKNKVAIFSADKEEQNWLQLTTSTQELNIDSES